MSRRTKQCPKCGSEVAQTALLCPHCRHSFRKGLQGFLETEHRGLKGAALIAVLTLLVGFLWALPGRLLSDDSVRRSRSVPEPSTSPAPPTPTPTPTPTPDSSKEPESTRAALYRPVVGGELSAGLSIGANHHLRGECVAGSFGNPGNPAAWRCFGYRDAQLGLIADPCWVLDAFRMICPRSPWVRTTRALIHSGPLPWELANAASRKEPWALELENGERCVHRYGGTIVSTAGGEVPLYQCATGEVFGVPDRSQEPWLAFYSSARGRSAQPVAIRVAWY